jgi:formyltetrahydrofolate-dependent phosphoribosylglycinamide formyltransferase
MKKIGFLLSGSGSTLQNFIDLQREGKLSGEIAVVISSRPDAYGLERARENNIPAFTVEYNKYKPDADAYSAEITKILKEFGVDLVIMGGFMSLYLVPPVFENKVVNVHPSLIPAFCGKGFYGHKVHEKVIESGVKVTGCTVHLVNNRYDQGPILAQGVVEVEDGDTPDTLAARVQAKERELYPKVVNDLLQGKIGVQGRKTRKLK